jgi:hypothetical protein
MRKGFDQALIASPLCSAPHVRSADLRVADRAHRQSSGVLAELLHQWEVANVIDENLAQVKAACDGQVWLMGKETWLGLMALAGQFWWSCRESNQAQKSD